MTNILKLENTLKLTHDEALRPVLFKLDQKLKFHSEMSNGKLKSNDRIRKQKDTSIPSKVFRVQRHIGL